MNSSAIYFDGKSSTPQNIQLSFDTIRGVLTISAPSFQKRINLLETKSVKNANHLTLQFGEDQVQQIKIDDLKFIDTIQKYLKRNNQINWYDKLIAYSTGTHIILSLLFLSFIGALYFYFVPLIAEKAVAIIPEEYDYQMSGLFIDEYLESEIVDAKKTKLLNDFSKELDLNNTKPLKFTVIESSLVNAFALPDGNIVVYTGLLNELKSANELVGLIGHEASHVNRRHSMKMLCRNLSGYLFISAVFNDVNGITAVIGDNIHSLQSMSYSRTFEKEADIDALAILNRNKIDPNGMLQLFERLEDNSIVQIPEFLSSHPITSERSNYIKELIKKNEYEVKENKRINALFVKMKKDSN